MCAATGRRGCFKHNFIVSSNLTTPTYARMLELEYMLVLETGPERVRVRIPLRVLMILLKGVMNMVDYYYILDYY